MQKRIEEKKTRLLVAELRKAFRKGKLLDTRKWPVKAPN